MGTIKSQFQGWWKQFRIAIVTCSGFFKSAADAVAKAFGSGFFKSAADAVAKAFGSGFFKSAADADAKTFGSGFFKSAADAVAKAFGSGFFKSTADADAKTFGSGFFRYATDAIARVFGAGFFRYATDAVARVIGAGIPFLQAPRTDTDTEDVTAEWTGEEEEQFTQMVSFLGKLFPFVRPSPEFRAQLKEALVAEHRQRLAYRAEVPAPQEGGISWRWSLAATVPLLIGVLATILWRRSHRSDEQLISPIGGR